MVLILATVAFVPTLEQVESGSSDTYWTYTITSDGRVTSSGSLMPGLEHITHTLIGKYDKSTDWIYDKVNPGWANVWTFDSEGYGPFGTFYAAFDACCGNRMLCHLDPDNLRSSLDKTITIDEYSKYNGHTVNIMWVLPTIYWSVDNSGNMILSNDPSKGTAYAHTFVNDGETRTYKYLGIGVYEASTMGEGLEKVLTSTTGAYPYRGYFEDEGKYRDPRADFRTYATRNIVATEDGTTPNGHAMLWNLYAWQLYRFCVLAVGGGWNSQGIFGNGNVAGEIYGTTGDLDASGPYAGNVGYSYAWASIENREYEYAESFTDHHSDTVKAFIENAWGGLNEFVDGVLIYANEEKTEVGMYVTQAAVPKDDPNDYDRIGTLPSSCGYSLTSTTSETNPGFWGLPTSTDSFEQLDDYDTGLYDVCSAGFSSLRRSSSLSPFGLYVGGDSSIYSAQAPYSGLSRMSSCSLDYSDGTLGSRLVFAFDPQLVVTYDTNGGTPEAWSESFQREQSIQVSAVIPQKEGCMFGGWDYKGLTLQPGDWIDTGSVDIVLTAIWGYKVTFDRDGGTWERGDTDYSQGNSYKIPYAVPAKDGSTFNGWRYGDSIVLPGGTIELDSDITLKAAWISESSATPFIPIIPDDGGDLIEVVVEKDAEPWLDRNGKSIILIAIIVAIIAELAVLCISRKR